MNKAYKILFASIVTLLIVTGVNFWYQTHKPVPIDSKKQTSGANSFEDYYNTAQSLKEEKSTTTDITFLAMGDIMLSRNVAGQMFKNGKDSYWPFRSLEDTLHSTDFNFANLESPFSGSDDFPSTGSLVFNAPTWTLPGLGQYNFKVLNLANNHALDQGKDGLLYTKSALIREGLTPVGVGANLKDAWQGQVYSVKGVRVGFIGASYSSINDGGQVKNDYVARIEDTAKLKAAIADLRTRADYVVVTMHAGVEYTRTPNSAQTTFARTAIDYGADIVIGAHPHWIQTNEIYKGKPIYYSLGNFVFDQMFSQDTKEGLMLKITLTKAGACATNASASPSGQQQVTCGDSLQGAPVSAKLKQIELLPVIIENYGQPRLANDAEKKSIFKKIGATTNVITP